MSQLNAFTLLDKQEIDSGEVIQHKIYLIRNNKVMLDRDLAKLYGVPANTLNLAVKRNPDRFPDELMYQLTKQELKYLRSQSVISSWGNIRIPPYAFTAQGVAMASCVLNSKRAIQVHIQIIRTFIKIREMMTTHDQIRQNIEEIKYDRQSQIVFDAIKQLL